MRTYLVVANQTLASDELLGHVREAMGGGPTRFHLVVPATPPREHLTWTEGSGHAIAERQLDRALTAFAAEGATVTGEVAAGSGLIGIPWPPGPMSLDPRGGFIFNVYTQPAHRKQGLARRLMDAIHDWCRAEGLERVVLNASTFGKPLYDAMGYVVTVNDPYKGVELVRAYSDPARGRHSLQVEINKRLYMDEAARARHSGFAPLQTNLMHLVEAIRDYILREQRRA